MGQGKPRWLSLALSRLTSRRGSLLNLRRGARPEPEVILYSRDGCGLCREAQKLLVHEARTSNLRVVDVDQSEPLQRQYGLRVPVVTIDGREVAEFELSPGVVRAALRRALRGPHLGTSSEDA